MDHPNQNIEQQLKSIYKDYYGLLPDKIIQLPHSGSNRMYFRLQTNNFSALGVYNDNQKENHAFINFTKQFFNHRINVPEIYHHSLKRHIYLIQDLGNTQLLSWLTTVRQDDNFPDCAKLMYKKVLQELVKIQIVAGRNFDYTYAYPYQSFHKESVLFDLNYFKKYFVDALKISYKSQQLTKDLNLFSNYLLQDSDPFFMYRDFQARNIMLVDDEPFFIDYQGGRAGALQYDAASLLFQAKANIPDKTREELLNYYIKIVKLFIPVNDDQFIEKYYAFALIRVLQTLGAYGLRGYIEKKEHFIESIPLAIRNLDYLIEKNKILNQLKELKRVIIQIINNEYKPNEK